MKKRIVMLIVFSILMINTVHAGIYFSDLEEAYNLGDRINLEVTVDPFLEEHLLEVNLVCDEEEVIDFNNYPDENGIVNIKFPLNYFTIQEAGGECYFTADYGDEKDIKSKKFEISKRLDVKLDTEAFFANPGEEILVSGEATRINSAGVNGSVEIKIPLLSLKNDHGSEEINSSEEVEETNSSENETSEEDESEEVPEIDNGVFHGKVKNGRFSVSSRLDDDIPAGDYRIDVVVYETSGDRRTSEGVAMANLEIFQVLNEVDIALSKQNIDPGEELNFKPLLMDQTGLQINDEVSVIIRDENSNRVFEQISNSKDTFIYKIPANMSSGYYEIEVSSEGVSAVKKFYINSKQIASFDIMNKSLVVTNIGNIPYKKDIQIELNGKPYVKKLNLNLGESREFKLTGANEEYNIRISDGEKEVSEEGIFLTGYSAGVKTVSENSLNLKTPMIWIFIILILIAVILFLSRNIFKKKSFAYPFKGKFSFKKKTNTIKHDEQGKVIREADVKKIGFAKKTEMPTEAQHTHVLKGERSRASIIALKIKNKIEKSSKKSLEKAMEPVYEKKGAVYEQGDYIYIIFSPLGTKSFKNDSEAAKVAEKIKMMLDAHNTKSEEKIDYGIAVGRGDIINKIEHGKLRFTALGDFLTGIKKLASNSEKQVLVSKDIYESGMSEVRAEKKGEFYELKKVINSDKNKKFIENFLKRMEKDEKK
ncbi:hypothetical protein GF386_03650 [Candidatus Pacearchaeota archaeon]|nr:hypothetical protein [Candidatus Pacearchaeota archaeon]MBD3283246.1 hypothetical protein [Candidatus Pacearchaeota archaeon]